MEKLIVYFAKNKLLVTIITLIVVIAGFWCYNNIKKESFPSTDLDMVIIQAIYPGATPDDVEKNAVIPIENQLEAISGIEEYTSVIIENAGIVTVTIDQKVTDKRPVKDEIFRKMQNVPNLSADVKDLNVIDVNSKMMPIYTFALHVKEGKTGTEQELYDFSRVLETALVRLDGVAEVRISGRSDPEVQIFADPKKMQQYYMSLNEIVQAMQTRNVRGSGGNLKTDTAERSIVTMGEFVNMNDVGDVIIRSNFDGSRVRLNDVAKIHQGFVEKNVQMRVNKTEGYSISIVKKENADILTTINEVKTWIKDNKNIVPSNLVITPMQDDSRTIQSLLSVVTSNLLSGFAIIFLVLLIFLDIRSALFTALGMILIVFGTLLYMNFTNITFNIISLAAIITVLGMIVDNSIVVSENIFNFKQRGNDDIDAIKLGVGEVVTPIIVSTLTTVTAFAPMLFLTGIMGKLIGQFPKVVIAALVISFFQAIFLLPNQLMSKKKKEDTPKKQNKLLQALDFDRNILFDKMKIPFGFLLEKALKWRYAVILGFVALLFGSFFLAQDSFKNFVLMYDTSADTLIINMETPIGTPLEKTSVLLSEVEEAVMQTVKPEELVAVYTLVGQLADGGVASEQLGNLGGITVYLVPSTERKRIAEDISRAINEKVDAMGIRQKVSLLTIGVEGSMGGTGKAVDIKIAGNDREKAKKIKEEIKAFLLNIDGVINYDDDDKAGKEELRVMLHYNKMAELGINTATIAREIRTAYNGTIATSVQGIDNKLEFRVLFDKNAVKNPEVLGQILIPNNTGRLIPLKDFSSIKIENGSSTLRHFNSERTTTLTADIQGEKITSAQVMNMVKTQFADISSRYSGMRIIFGGEAKQTVEAVQGLLFSFLIAIVAIYIILLLQFNRLIQPLLILLIIPFGLIGVFLAFAAHGMPMSFMGFIGVIGLAGVVVNNGIIMVDMINKIIDEGVQGGKDGIRNAILEGAKSRLRPVFLTTITTILGLLPTVYGIGGRADLIVPIVMAMAYGLLFASLLTLIFLPCIFLITFDLKLVKIKE